MSITVPGLSEKDPLRIASAIRSLAEGRSNAPVTATLAASATTTTVPAVNCAAGSVVLAIPMSSTAAGTTGLWIEAGNGEFTVHHNSSAATDRLFGFVPLG